MDLYPVGEAFRDAVVAQVALQSLVHSQITLPLFVIGAAGSGDLGGIEDRTLPHRDAQGTEVSLNGLRFLLTQPVLLQQVADCHDCRLNRDQVTDAGKATHGWHLDQGRLHRRSA